MKTIFKVFAAAISLILISAQCEKEPDTVYITDDAFLAALIEEGVDANGDGQISYAEAEAITKLGISGKQITSMDGIQAFVNLEGLYLSDCQIINPDFSALTALEVIDIHDTPMQKLDLSQNNQLGLICCPGNQIIQLILNENAPLELISCPGNKINKLDLTGCTELQVLYCDRNQISNLDLSDCPLLEKVDCSANRLTSLDISNNSKLGSIAIGYRCLDISGMPSLQKVCVWTMPFPPEGLVISTEGSPNVYFTTECRKFDLSRIIH